MRNPRHIALALAIVVIWGVNFVAISHALDGFPPILLATLRFALTGTATLFLPRPKEVRWYWIAGISTFMFFGQYVLLFTGMAHGMPDGLASLVLQSQAPFTVLAAALLLGERTGLRQALGIAAAVAGLGVIGAGRGGNVPLGSLLLVIGAGASWALGSICNRKAGAGNGFALMVWASLYATPPLLAVSLLAEGPHRIGHAFAHLHAGPVLGLLYVVLLSTFVGLGAWVMLITKYPASAVAPYTLGVPPIGILAALIANGERMTALEMAGSVVVLGGLVAIVWPRRKPAGARIAPEPSVPAARVEESIQAA
ncbi:EamA family transporter [Catenulispora rubra]|uniref:EamA family transporter n=1 Tax=Catenulispora rubra TaxID=280293 RepID=UPI00189202C5|nr:EamA family transporter [Catenulispora rubra]